MAADLPEAELETPMLELGARPVETGGSGLAAVAGAVAAGAAGVVVGKKLADKPEAVEGEAKVEAEAGVPGAVVAAGAAGVVAGEKLADKPEGAEGEAKVAAEAGVPGAVVAAGVAGVVAGKKLAEKPEGAEGEAKVEAEARVPPAVIAAGVAAGAAAAWPRRSRQTGMAGLGPRSLQRERPYRQAKTISLSSVASDRSSRTCWPPRGSPHLPLSPRQRQSNSRKR